jgi:hypothetical protein
MKNNEDSHFRTCVREAIIHRGHTSFCAIYLDILPAIAAKGFCVSDRVQKQFCYIKLDDLFLCGFSAKDILKEKFGFYSKIVCSKICLYGQIWTRQFCNILKILMGNGMKRLVFL